MGAEFEARLEGADAELGRVAAADVGRLLVGIERAVQVAAAVAVQKRPKPTGRRVKAAEDAAKIRLKSINRGSVASVLELPDVPLDEGALGLELQHLGEQALDQIMDMVAGDREPDPAVTRSLEQLVDDVGIGRRYDGIRIRRLGSHDAKEALVTAAAVTRMRESQPEAADVRDETLVGELVEADFEKRTARLKTQLGEDVVVTFDESLAGDIHWALPPGHEPGRPIRFQGHVTYDARTSAARSVTVRSIEAGEQLAMPVTDVFWWRPTVDDLAHEQGVRPVDSRSLFNDTIDDDEAAALLSALGDL